MTILSRGWARTGCGSTTGLSKIPRCSNGCTATCSRKQRSDHGPPVVTTTPFTFVTDGIESALAKAREAAGEKRIGLMGANIDQQCLAAGLVHEIRIHVVNVLLGGGRRLFDELPQRIELEHAGLSETDGATHLEYRVVR